MTRRTPLAKAFVSGATAKNPARYTGRGASPASSVGDPPQSLGKAEREAWAEFVDELPWLTFSHRAILHLASVLRVKVTDGKDGINHLSVYSACLSKLGATPSDESKVAWSGEDEGADPAERFFGRA